jgi:hypothetical protein
MKEMKMSNPKTQPVQGFKVKTFTVKKDTISLILNADKEEIRAGDFDLGDILAMLELHSTSDFTVELTLVRRDK